MMNKSICAVVVTYNRKNLLINCLNALKNQTYPLDHIVVIDNASQDGTVGFLHENAWINNEKFTLVTLSENQGGAGGFYAGIEFALQQQFDYVWLMDDDGFPSENCLEKLIPYANKNSYIGPIVLDNKTKEKISFAVRLPNSLSMLDSYQDIPDNFKKENKIEGVILPFNGTLIACSLIQKMGLPLKEYFIWGDEREYTARARKFKAEIFSIVDAIFYHPVNSSVSQPMFFGKLRFNYANSDLKQYCFLRNSISMFAKYNGVIYATAFFLKSSWFYLFTKPSFSRLLFAWRAMFHGLRNDFTHHKDYLK